VGVHSLQVRVHALDVPGAAPSVYAAHTRRVKKLVTLPDAPHALLSASEDGTVRHFDTRAPPPPAPAPLGSARFVRDADARNVLLAVQGGRVELHSLSVAPLRPELLAVGGRDATVRVYDRRFLCASAPAPVAAFCPAERRGGGAAFSYANVTGVAFSADGSQLLGSYMNAPVYLFNVAPRRADAGDAANDVAQTVPASAAATATAAAAGAARVRDEEMPQLTDDDAEEGAEEEEEGSLAAVGDALAAAAAGDVAAAEAALSAALLREAQQEEEGASGERRGTTAALLHIARAEARLALAGGDSSGAAHAFAEGALADARRACALAPRRGEAPFAAARALRALRRPDDALTALAEAEALSWSAQLRRCAPLIVSMPCAHVRACCITPHHHANVCAHVCVFPCPAPGCGGSCWLRRAKRAATAPPQCPSQARKKKTRRRRTMMMTKTTMMRMTAVMVMTTRRCARRTPRRAPPSRRCCARRAPRRARRGASPRRRRRRRLLLVCRSSSSQLATRRRRARITPAVTKGTATRPPSRM
jgi:hypothetical protein